MKRRWTETEEQIVRERFPNTTARNIATVINRTIAAIQKRAQILGVKKEYPLFCRVCGSPLTVDNWPVQRRRKWGRVCIVCRRKYLRDYRRKHIVSGTNGSSELFGIKRPFPTNQHCELCGRRYNRLEYHHWDDNELLRGVWVDPACHKFIHRLENGFADKWFDLKNQVEKKVREGRWKT